VGHDDGGGWLEIMSDDFDTRASTRFLGSLIFLRGQGEVRVEVQPTRRLIFLSRCFS